MKNSTRGLLWFLGTSIAYGATIAIIKSSENKNDEYLSGVKSKKTPVVDESQFNEMGISAVRKHVMEYYTKNLQGTSVFNTQKQITIHFTKDGLKHIIYGRKFGYQKFKAIMALKEMMTQATFSNFKAPDVDDAKYVEGYLNFQAQVVVENEKFNFRIVVQKTTTGKYLYDHVIYENKKA
jgi:hypothetical protein